MDTSSHTNLVLFDGECNLCDGFVQFLIRQDHRQVLRFGPLQSENAKKYITEFTTLARSGQTKSQMPQNDQMPQTGQMPQAGKLTSMIYIRNDDRFYTKSTAALRILQDLGGLWRLTGLIWIIPRPVRDAIYDWVGRNRYRWFGKKTSCMVPTTELRSRFIS